MGVTPMTALMISFVQPSSAMISSFESVVLRERTQIHHSAHVGGLLARPHLTHREL